MDAASVASLLESTLAPDNASRNAAEARVDALALLPGWPSGLMQLVCAPGCSATVQLAAALALKRAAQRAWHSDEPSVPSPYTAEEKEFGAWGVGEGAAPEGVGAGGCGGCESGTLLREETPRGCSVTA